VRTTQYQSTGPEKGGCQTRPSSINTADAALPDLPGCLSTGKTPPEIRRFMKEGIEFHIESMLRDGETVPAPTTVCEYVQGR
jgi:predicted RNase H-like HicB family nuclease